MWPLSVNLLGLVLRIVLFSSRIFSQIVRRRKDFEYSLRKRQTRKIDFLRYIEYEMSVDSLRKLRKSQRKIHLKTTSPCELAIIKRLHFTFKVRRGDQLLAPPPPI